MAIKIQENENQWTLAYSEQSNQSKKANDIEELGIEELKIEELEKVIGGRKKGEGVKKKVRK